MRVHEHVGPHAWVCFALVVREQDDIVARVELLLDFVKPVPVADPRLGKVDEGADVFLAELKVVVGRGDGLVVGGEGVGLRQLVDDCVCRRAHRVSPAVCERRASDGVHAGAMALRWPRAAQSQHGDDGRRVGGTTS